MSHNALLLVLALAASVDDAATWATQPEGPIWEADTDDRTVIALHRACQVGADHFESWCEAYLLGVADMLVALGKDGICDADRDPEAIAWTFMIWAQAHRDWWEFDMLAGALAALRERWPCR